MAYTTINFKTKKALKDALKARKQIEVYQPNGDVTGFPSPREGRVFLEGPHYPAPHTWYAEGTLSNGILIKVK